MTRLLLALLLLAGVGLASPATGQSRPVVTAAKAMGQIGERYDGYIGYVVSPTLPVRRQVEAVNIRRRALYNGLGVRRGVSPMEIGITAGCETLRRVRVGEFYLLGDNAWRRREPGQPAPVPDYCG